MTFVDEARAAARGVFALVMGDRGASRYFSFTQLGLVSSFIAVLAVTAVELVVTMALGSGGVFTSLVQTVIAYGAVLGASALYLRQIGRPDALAPFVVTINWSNAVLTVVLLVTVLVGLSFLGIVVLIAGLVVSINIARLVMTLKPVQIVLLILAQAAGLLVALLLIVLLFPPTPEQLAEATAAAAASSPPS
ncbi:MAG: hypothetical protein JWQ89_3155 [Devosia sp.]|uniref:hypothetical protein n=1 Tax=Devosia sp. TaxID=1871048 RepID=UPI002609AD1E|nr:hypothetical protein [Devosia sp.]MDB5541428.1 hypothetical protein [Devosia sp.]